MSDWYNLIIDKDDEGALDVYILDEIGKLGTNAESFISAVKENSDVEKEVRVHINSPGGSIIEGLAIYYFLKARGNVTTIIDGVAASMASVIFMAGSNRIMPENALMMIHNPLIRATGGNAKELRDTAETLDKMGDSIAGIYANATGKDVDSIKDMLSETTWMNGTEAVQDGFATMITDAVEMAASFDIGKLTVVPDALAKALESKENEMEKVDELQAKLQEAEAKLEEGTKEAEAKAKESFDAGVGTGEEQALGKIKSRMDKYQDAAFVIETIDLDDGAVKDKHIAKLEAEVKAKDEAIAELSKDEGETAIESKATASSPEEVTVEAKSKEELYEARVAELKAEGKSAEDAHRTAHDELDKQGE